MTLTEVLVTIGVVLLLFLVLVYASLPQLKAIAIRQNCYSNLRAGSAAFWDWAGDNNDKMPMELSTNNGGAREWMMQGKVSEVFLIMSNEFGTPRILICPADSRTWVTNWNQFDNQHLSYFVNADAHYNTNFSDPSMSVFLFGDRNLTNGTGPKNGILELTVGVEWTTELHNGRGNICLANGAVLKLKNSNLRTTIEATGSASNRLAIP